MSRRRSPASAARLAVPLELACVPCSAPGIDFLDERSLHEGHARLDSHRVRFQSPDGHLRGEHQRDVVRRPDAVAVLPIDMVSDECVLIAQPRVPVAISAEPDFLLECPGGFVRPREPIEAAVHREAREEAGLKLSSPIPVGVFYPAPGLLCERVHVFLAIVISQQHRKCYGVASRGEAVSVRRFRHSVLFDMVHQGRIRDLRTMVAVQQFMIGYSAFSERLLASAPLAED